MESEEYKVPDDARKIVGQLLPIFMLTLQAKVCIEWSHVQLSRDMLLTLKNRPLSEKSVKLLENCEEMLKSTPQLKTTKKPTMPKIRLLPTLTTSLITSRKRKLDDMS